MASQLTQRSVQWLEAAARSVWRIGWPRTDKDRAAVMISSFFLHIHPARVSRHVLRPSYTLGLGLVSAILFGVLTVTGLALMLYYVPHPPEAYGSMQDLQFVVTFGVVLRNMHRWSAHAMVFVVFLHLCRVFWTGSYKPPREFNWTVGVALLLLTLALSFTGYLLPWDQLAYWAVTIATGMLEYVPLAGGLLVRAARGGPDIGPATLARFFVLHVALLPIALLALLSFRALAVKRLPDRTGVGVLVGQIVAARTDLAPTGKIFVDGAIWEARSSAPVAAELLRVCDMLRVDMYLAGILMAGPVAVVAFCLHNWFVFRDTAVSSPLRRGSCKE